MPVEIGNLSSLGRLRLSDNQLSTLPAEVGNLSSLQNLFLENNRLSTLPAELGNLSHLQALTLENNPLQTPLPGIVAQGIRATLAYLQGSPLESAEKQTAHSSSTCSEPSSGVSGEPPLQPLEVETFSVQSPPEAKD